MTYRHRLMIRMRPVLRFIRNRILHVDDSPQRLARGIAVGLFIGFLPLFGLQMILAYLVAKPLRANRVLAMLSVWISNPFTAVFVYYPCYRLGRFLLTSPDKPQIGLKQLEHIFENVFTAENIFHGIFTAQFWKEAYRVFMQIGLETTLGGILLGLVVAGAGYGLSVVVIQRYRVRKHHFFKRLALRRQSAHHRAE